MVCTIMAIGCGFWEYQTGFQFGVYLPRESFVSSNRRIGSIHIGLLVFLSYVILLNTVVPISLYISIEIIRLVQSKWISWDNQMYDASTNIPAEARTATLNEELGQIDYIFSDKTGTLTQVDRSNCLERRNFSWRSFTEHHDVQAMFDSWSILR